MIAAWLVERVIRMPAFKGRFRLIKLLLRLADGQTITSRYGVRMRVRAADFTNQAAIAGTFPRDYDDVYAEMVALEPGMAFIDVGANQGLFTLVAGQRVGPQGVVLAFEPDLTNFQYLVRNILENHLTNVFPVNGAISEKSGVENFQPAPETHSGIGRIAPDGPTQIMVMNFADNMALFSELLGDRRLIIKIDVEGHEAHVVHGLCGLLNNDRAEKLIIEVDEENLVKSGSTAAELYDTLTAAGFEARRGRGAASHFNEVFLRVRSTESAASPIDIAAGSRSRPGVFELAQHHESASGGPGVRKQTGPH
ncbi:MAG TPA: FkbM family methyltransferase [Terrimicrobiaceae bacterium]|nr:FkbM family methyltransferase [Terrimicrobiaceae bacterium]